MIDQNARSKLQNMQTAKAIADGIDRLTSAIKETSVVNPKPQVKTPASDLADELRSLQKMIGGGNLTESLLKLSQSLDKFDVNENALGQLKGLVADLSAKLRVLAEIEAKLPKDINLNFPEDVEIKGKVDVGTIEDLPPVKVTNLDEVAKGVGMLINNLQVATVKAIERTKTEFPKQLQIDKPIKVEAFQELLEGIEELKKGFNLLINKEAATIGFPNKSIPVEVQNWKVAQPVSHVSINGLRGFVKARAVTVTTTLTPLPGEVLSNRRSLVVYNNSASTTIYVGGSDVTAAEGIPVPASTYSPAFDASENLIVYAVTASGSADVRVLEMSDEAAGR